MTTVPGNVKEWIFKLGQSFFGKRQFSAIAAKMDRGLNLDFNEVRRHYRDIYPESRIIGRNEWYESIYAAFYSSAGVNNLVPGDDIASVASYVPYFKGFTSAILYNFFRQNYNIRSPILYRITIFSDSNFVWSKQKLIPSGRVVLIEDLVSDYAELPRYGTLVIEAFHPRIFVKTRQLRFIAIYRDRENGIISGSHSMPLEGLFPRLIEPSYRAFAPTEYRCSYHSAIFNNKPLTSATNNSNKLLKLNSISPVTLGYMTLFSETGCPGAIWHDGTSPHVSVATKTKREIGCCTTAFYIPDFIKHCPRVLLSKKQLGFQPTSVKIYLKNESGELVATKIIPINNEVTTIDFQTEFESNESFKGMVVLLEFDQDVGHFVYPPVTYVHIYYRSPNGPGDQVHSHHTTGYEDDPSPKGKSYRCRKFAPYIKDEGLDHVYSIVNTSAGLKLCNDSVVKVRLITDTGFEDVLYKNLNNVGVSNFGAKDLFPYLDDNIQKTAVLQFEHETTNFQCSWFVLDNKTGNLAVDHFTGG